MSDKSKSLPAAAADHKALAATYKKNGSFDHKRKILLQNFKASQTHSNLLLKLKVMVESKIRNDPSILLKNKGKTAALIQGEVINGNAAGSSILSIVDKDIQEKIIDSPDFHLELKDELKDIRRKLLGVSDEDYAKQLEQEKLQKAEEDARKERERAEREVAYKNNFRVKQLAHPQKIVKPPRFAFHSMGYREDRTPDTYFGASSATDSYRGPKSGTDSYRGSAKSTDSYRGQAAPEAWPEFPAEEYEEPYQQDFMADPYRGPHPQSDSFRGLHPQSDSFRGLHPQSDSFRGPHPPSDSFRGPNGPPDPYRGPSGGSSGPLRY